MSADRTAGSCVPWAGPQHSYVVYNDVELDEIATGDVVMCLDIPAGTFVERVAVKVLTPTTATTASATAGDGSGAAKWISTVDAKGSAGTVTNGAVGTDDYVTSNGKFYASADTIDLTFTITGGPCSDGKLRVYAICNTFV